MKKIYLILVLACMFATNILKAETEPNDSKAQANALALTVADVGTVSLTESDWFSVSIPEDGDLNIELTSSVNTYIQILDNDGTTSLLNLYALGTVTRTVNGLAAGTYYVRLYNYYAFESSNYTITATLTTTGLTNDVEFNGSVATASTLPLNGTVTGHVNYYYNNERDTTDWYAVTVNQDGKLSYTITSSGLNVYALLFDGDGITSLAGSYTTSTATYFQDGLAPGTYYIKIYTYYSNDYVAYTLSNTLTPPVNANDPTPNEIFSNATILPLNSSATGHIGFRYNGSVDVYDWYSVTTNADGALSYTITVDNSNNVYAELFDGDGTTELNGNYTTTTATFTEDGLAVGTYYIRIRTYYTYEFASYILSNNLTEPLQSNDPNPNETFGAATPFSLNSSVTGHIGYAYNGADDLLDWYAITTADDGKISFSITSHNNQNVYAELFDGDGTTELAGNYSTTTGTYEKDGLAAGTYYIRIRNYYNFEWAPYTLSNSIQYPVQTNDAEPNGTIATGIPYTPGDSVTGHIGYSYSGADDLEDWYVVTLSDDGKFSWSITSHNNQNVYARLYDTNGTTLLGGSYTSGTANYSENNLAAGVYYLKINTYSTAEFAPYTLSSNLEPMNWAAENPAPNNFAITPTLLPSNTPSTGHLNFYNNGTTDTRDWWIIGYDGSGNLTLTCELEQNHFNASYPSIAYAVYADTAASSIASGTWTLPSTNVNLTGLAVGKYYVRLTQSAGTFGAYRLTATYTENCANIIAVNASSQSIPCEGSISYTVSNGLADYTVQLYKDGNPYGAPQTTSGSVSYSNLPLGTYFLRAFSFGASGTCNNISGNTVFAAPAIPVITAGSSTTFCSGQSVTLTSSAADSYLWSTGETTQSIVVSSAGSYNVTVYNAALCSNVSASTDVIVNPLPTPSISPSGSTTFCPGGNVTLDAGAGYTAYLWSDGSTTQSITVSTSGTFTVTVTDGNGCTGTSPSVTTTVGANLSPVITPLGSLTFCAGGSVVLDAGVYASYLWSDGSTTQSISVSTSGTFTVTVTDGNGCTGTSPSVTTTVGTNLSPVITPSGPLAFCAGGNVVLDAGVYASYLWSDGSTTQSISVSTSGTFTVTVTDGNGCTGTSPSVTTSVGANLSPVITPSGSLTFCVGGSVVLDAGAYTSYLWSDGSTTQSISVSTSGTFNVAVTDGNGCTGTSGSVTVTVKSLPTVSLDPFVDVCSTDAPFVLSGGSPAGGNYSGNGVSSGSFNPATAGIGVHIITYTFNDLNGCSNSATSTIEVTDCGCIPPAPITAINGQSGVCQGQSSVTFSVANDPNATSYVWTLPNGLTGTSTANSITVSVSATYTNASICVVASNACGQTQQYCRLVSRYTVQPGKPDPITGSASACLGSTQTYSVPQSNNVISYAWTVPAGSLILSGQGTNSVEVQFGNVLQGAYVGVSASNCIGTSAIRTFSVHGLPKKPSEAVGLFPKTGVCANNTYNYAVVPVAVADDYTWTAPVGAVIFDGVLNGNPLTSTSANVQITFPSGFVSGTVGVFASNVCGSSAVRSAFVRAFANTPENISGPRFAMCGTTGQTYSVTPVVGASSYSWTVPAGATIVGPSNGNSISVDFAPNFTIGSICVAAVNVCGNSVERCMVVQGRPGPPNAITGPLTVCKNGGNYNYSVLPFPGAVTYVWQGSNGVIVTGNTENVALNFLNVNTPTSTISARALNACGKSEKSFLDVQVDNCRFAGEPTVSDLVVFPNTASESIAVSFSSNQSVNTMIKISDLNGRVVKMENYNCNTGFNQKSVDVSKLAPGTYMLSVTNDAFHNQFKIVIQ
ncbi:MAG: T9SS type A sorting domain-containing protein [Bacteroidetes bacterium]|nr:T9SS type A sorting domain-containing protein [Bacteroidota bacterium]